ncbi:MAG: electron transport complex subunit RsxA [Rhodocyclales bacterium]|nr:electron transport complex subunit RsxA [Rhodocyclales bacterium]
MASYIFILLGAVLVNNVVLVRILGLCPFMGVSKKLETALGMGAATTFVLTLGCGTSYVIDHWLLLPYGLDYLRTLSFIVTIAAIVQFTELVVQKTSPALHHGFIESLLFGFGSSLGFSLALILFAGLRERLEGAEVPVYFRGNPIALITGGLMSLAFMGFAGLDKYH